MSAIEVMQSCAMLQGLSVEELAVVERVSDTLHYAPGEEVIREGELTNDLYVILSGKVAVTKAETSEGTLKQFPLAIFERGAGFGEIAFMDHLPRSSSVQALEPTTVLCLKKERISQHHEPFKKIIRNISRTSVDRMRTLNIKYIQSVKDKLKQAQERHDFGVFFLCFFLSLSLLEFITRFFIDLDIDVHASVPSVFRLLLAAVPCLILIKKWNYPLSQFGVTLQDWKICIIEGLVISLILSILIILANALYLTAHEKPFIPRFNLVEHNSIWFWIFVYPFHSYLQEFLARGVVQTSLQRFLNDQKGYFAILLTSLIFSAVHTFNGEAVIMGTFLGGIIFGLVYLRRKNLIEVTVIHMIVGAVLLTLSD